MLYGVGPQPGSPHGRCAIKPRSAGDFYVGAHMTNDANMLTRSTAIFLLLLMVGEIFVASNTPEGRGSFLSAVLNFAVVSGAPLLALFFAVLKGSKRTLALSSAWASIVVGFLVQWAFHGSNDPSRVMLLAFSIITYWISGLVALFSFGYNKHR